MRARSSLLLLAAVLGVSAHATAESGHRRGVTLGLTAVQPLPPWKDAGFGVAPWLGYATPLWRNWCGTVRAGWIGHVQKQQTVGGESIHYSNWELPLVAGVEYSRSGEQGLLLCAELGYVMHRVRAEYRYEPVASSTDHRAGLSLGGGYRINRFQVRVQLFMLGIPDPVKDKALVFGMQWTLPMGT